MEMSLLVWSRLFFSAALFLLLINWKKCGNDKRPPGPPGWPVIGNILDLGPLPHRDFYELRSKYGPVLGLKLGSVNTMVIQSAKAATEFFKHHDHIFSDRKYLVSLTAHNYYQGSLAMGRYGVYWRILRRICSTELLASKRINETVSIREECIDNMIRHIEEDVQLSHYLFFMSFNLVGKLTLLRDLLRSQSREGQELFEAMKKVMELDPQGIKRNMVRDLGRSLEIVSGFIKERVEEQFAREKRNKDFLDGLLEYEGDGKEGPDRTSDQNVKIIILEMFFAGSETTSSTMEWTMAELLRNPESMEKTKEELDRVVGRNRKVDEKDIDELPYLKAVVKETLTLSPPIPLLLPRNTMQETKFMGYLIPKDTQVFVNTWAIGRDPECWEDPMSFKPERFLGSNIEFKGQNFELLPFGSGRRICVGIALVERVLHLGVASLLHHFDWELGKDVTPETMDMNDRMGMTARKLVPLKVIPKKRVSC
ncbi:hypothetical protein ACOSQ3_030078 [Xanthoceras sorbifolium]